MSTRFAVTIVRHYSGCREESSDPIDKISAFESQYVQWEKELNLVFEVFIQSIQDESAMDRTVPGEMEALLLRSSTLKVDH